MTGAHAGSAHGHDGGPRRPHRPDGESTPAATHRDGPVHGRQQPRRLAWRIGTPAVVLLSGALFVTSAVDSEGTDLRPGRYTDLAGVVAADAAEYRALEKERQRLDEEVHDLTARVRDAAVTRARGELAALQDPAGLRPRQGPGLTITLSDSPDETLEQMVKLVAETETTEDDDLVNRLVVHQQDLQAVVNALWKGGAAAVTVAGQRVITTTGIKCEGNAVQLQGVPYPQPFVVQAVGDPAELIAAIDADPLVSGYRADAANPDFAIGWSMEVEEHVEAPAFTGVHEMRYATPLRG